NRVPSAFGPRPSPIENPLQGIGAKRPIARNGKLSLSLRDVGRHAVPPRRRRTGGERRKNSGTESGTPRSALCRFVPFRSDIVLGAQIGDTQEMLKLYGLSAGFVGRSAEI